mgnify:FL=1
MERSQVAIVIPALNEESTICNVISGALDFGSVIVVNDGSIDETSKISKLAGAIVVNHDFNKGYDAALNSGFKEAELRGFEYILSIDADGQHNPLLIKEILDEFKPGIDIVSAIRDKKQRIGEHIFDFFTCTFLSIRDPLCGMKAFKVKILKDLKSFNTFESIGTQLLIFASIKGYKVSQINILTNDRKDKSRFQGSIIGNYKIIRALLITIKKIIIYKLAANSKLT